LATVNDFGIPGVGTGILHPKMKHLWRVTFANLGGGIDSQPISMQAITVSRPSLSFESIELNRYNTKTFVAGKHTFETMNLVIEDDVTSSATKVIREQISKQQWLIGAQGPWLGKGEEGSLYKFVTYIDQLDGKETVIEKWVVEGCWIQTADYTDLDYADSAAVQINLTIQYDHARQENLNNYDAGEGVATGGAGIVSG
jgi:hypothetical protein